MDDENNNHTPDPKHPQYRRDPNAKVVTFISPAAAEASTGYLKRFINHISNLCLTEILMYACGFIVFLLIASNVIYRLNTVDPDGLFIKAKTDSELKQLVANSIERGRPVMIEFFANWCHYCKALDRDVLSDPAVQDGMKTITAIRVDASDGTEEQRTMMESNGVRGFPTLIFYTRQGVLYNAYQFDHGYSTDSMLTVFKEIKQIK